MRVLRELRGVILFYLVFLAGYTLWGRWEKALSPPDPEAPYVEFEVFEGEPFSKVAGRLEAEGIIRSHLAFRALAALHGAERAIKAGRYRLSGAMEAKKVLFTLLEGRTLQIALTVPEGYNIYEIARLLQRSGIMEAEEFLKAARDQALLKELGIRGESAEGFLFPDTYFLPYGVRPEELVRIMVKRFWRLWKEAGLDERARKLGLSVEEAVTLASLVEEEAMKAEERPLIAGVFWNRLRRGMPLQSDPTVLYGRLLETGRLKRRLRWRDLRHPTPYNTYVKKGLPKGPISNPGLQSLKAALYPAETEFLYFVSKNDGTHKFSKDLREHEKAVYEYQIRRSRPRVRGVK